MKNVTMKLQGTKLVIEIDTKQECGPSASGKNIIVASTGGFTSVPGIENLRINLTATKKPETK